MNLFTKQKHRCRTEVENKHGYQLLSGRNDKLKD